ncbi:MAG: hypothetical protein U0836_26080 [Pirellulales bacterium]
MVVWVAALLHVGLPAGLIALAAMRLMARPPWWVAGLLATVPLASWTTVAAFIGWLLPADALEPFLWFAAE